MELSSNGKSPITLPGGESRSFLQDGDTVTLRAHCASPGAVRIGLGEVSGTIVS
jgi:fumarylacetoacetase